MTVACLLPDKGRFSVVRSLMHFGSPESLPTRSVLMANPTPGSRISSLLRPLHKNVEPAPTSMISPTSARRFSLRAAISILYLPSSLLTRAVLRCDLSDAALSISMRTFQTSNVKSIAFVIFLRQWSLRAIPADRGLPARGFETGSCLGHLF